MAAFVLGLLILGAFLSYLVLNNLSDRLFDPQTYTDALLEGNAYQRLYSEVLPKYGPEALVRVPLKETPLAVLADLADTVPLLLELMPPEYLQSQVESNIERSAAYFTQETDRLELYLELEEPLANLESAFLDSMDRRIDAAEINDVVDQLVGLEPGPGSLQFDQAGYSRELTEFLNVLLDAAQGHDETLSAISIISLSAVPESLRMEAFDLAMASLERQRSLDPRSLHGLRAAESALREQLLAGDTREFLRQAVRAAAVPVLDDIPIGYESKKIEAGIEGAGRLDLIALYAWWSEGVTETELRRKIERFRVDVHRVFTQGQIWSIGIVALGTIAIGALYLPNWGRCLRLAGLTLLLTGLVALVAGWLAEAILPGLLSRQGALILTLEFGLPPEVVSLASDVFRLVLARQLGGIFLPALAPILVGAAILCLTNVASQRRLSREISPQQAGQSRHLSSESGGKPS